MYNNDRREGEGVVSYPGGRQDVGIWRGPQISQLKFVINEIALEPRISHHASLRAGLDTPDLQSRGSFEPKGYLEVSPPYQIWHKHM